MKFKITSDINKAIVFAGRMRKQIPYAASLALNSTAFDVRAREIQALDEDLDRPTPGIKKSMRVDKAHKLRLEASIYVAPWADRFLGYQVRGGRRPARGRVEAVPVGIKLNQYGNIRGRRSGALRKVIRQKNVFSGKVRGVDGIWRRYNKGRNVKLLVAYHGAVEYGPAFDFYGHAEREASRRWPIHFKRAIARAIRSAR